MVPPTDFITVCDGNWHELVVRKTSVVGEIVLDGVHVATGSAPAGTVGVNTYAPLYFGGLPGRLFTVVV